MAGLLARGSSPDCRPSRFPSGQRFGGQARRLQLRGSRGLERRRSHHVRFLIPEGNHRGEAYAASRRRTSPRRAEILLGSQITVKTTVALCMRNYKSDLIKE